MFLARPEMPTTFEIASEISAKSDVEGRVARPSAAIPPVGPKAAVALVRLVAPLQWKDDERMI